MVIELPNKTVYSRIVLISKKQLLSIPTRESQLITLYRRYMRLSYFFPKKKYADIYKSIIKSRFESLDVYNKRFRAVHGDQAKQYILNDELFERAINTLEFVSKAMTFTDDFYSNIVMNIVRTEESKLLFLDKLRKSNKLLDYYVDDFMYHSTNLSKNSPIASRVKIKEINGNLVSLKHFDITLMKLNETANLCL